MILHPGYDKCLALWRITCTLAAMTDDTCMYIVGLILTALSWQWLCYHPVILRIP